ncbi:uncharacterized protein LOC129290525 [Prosopis cineraria]|uniref:uncharacterized protein LOC129290525 n=1 Tax=Prosopis cineraria TaxID=364024 RepID=UPI00240EDB55|nr:uncharacterized protein LOC129290525 [Prosopis cineraria]
MRSITSCYNEHAVRISDSYCSGPSNQAYLCPKQSLSVRESITCTYRVNVSSQKQILITLNWTKKLTGQGFSIAISNTNSTSHANSMQLGKNKGNETFQIHDFKIQVQWDLSDAKYDSGPEPASGFYVIVHVDSELGLRLGDKEEESSGEVKAGMAGANSSMVCRRERFSGGNIYSTKAQFCETGAVHEIVIKWVMGEEGSRSKGHVLCVSIDKKTILEVKRVRWNFRGNQAIFLDGLLVDMMWDVHDWLFKASNRSAVFMFRTRSGMDSRLWLEEKTIGALKDPHRIGFSLLLCACNDDPD